MDTEVEVGEDLYNFLQVRPLLLGVSSIAHPTLCACVYVYMCLVPTLDLRLAHMYRSHQSFFAANPRFAKQPFYLFGESYGASSMHALKITHTHMPRIPPSNN